MKHANRPIWVYALLVFGIVILSMVVIFFVKRQKLLKEAAKKAGEKKQEQAAKETGTQQPPWLPPVNTGGMPPAPTNQNPSPTPTPPVVNEIPSYIEKLCWMANEISKTGYTSDARCEVCNNLQDLSNSDLDIWQKTYQTWYGTSLRVALSNKNFFDCGCIPFFCGCSKPNLSRLWN